MSTKSTIQTLINTNLADSSAILASEHRAVENALLNELYPTTIVEDNGTTFVFTKTTDDVAYELFINKQGNVVNIVGYLQNNTIEIYSGYIADITNSEFLPFNIPSGGLGNYFGLQNVNIENDKLKVINLGSASFLKFEFTYFTQN